MPYSHQRARGDKPVWRPSGLAVSSVLVAFVGMLLGVYPHAASWVSELNQTQAAQSYISELSADPHKEQQLADAHEYNEMLNMGVDLLANERIPTSTGSVAKTPLIYERMLDSQPSKIMARLRVDKIGIDLPVYHGTSDETLLKGAGHLKGSSLPVGGVHTHAVITAHRGLASATMFNNLPQIAFGDTFTLEVFGEVLTYRVIRKDTVKPEETEILRVLGDEDLVTLVTCTPLGINSHRLLVTAERVSPTPKEDIEKAGSPSNVPGFPYWIIVLVLGTSFMGFALWRLGLNPAPRPVSRN